MRKIVGQAVVTAALAAVALVPLAGTASAATAEPVAKPAAADRCWWHHGHLYCSDYGPWHHHTGVGVGLGLGIGLL